MKTTRLRLHRDTLRSDLLPLLRRKVFHVTTHGAAEKIVAVGALHPNSAGNLGYTYEASERSYFRQRRCVSLFDLRAVTDEQLEWVLMKFPFLNPGDGDKPAFFVFGVSVDPFLIPWNEGPPPHGVRMVIPYAEAGFPGSLPVTHAEDLIVVDLFGDKYAQLSPFMRELHGLTGGATGSGVPT